jgi:polysaccharide deacetylase 2 family uncharacterized protein YibQ
MRAVPLLAGWKGLGRFWLGIAVLAICGAIVLQVLGPPSPPDQKRAGTTSLPAAEAARPGKRESNARPFVLAVAHPPDTIGRFTPGPVADPDPGLLEDYRETPAGTATAPANAGLPRVASDGRMPMHEYASGFDPTTRRPRVGIIVAGIGMNEADSLNAIHQLPGPVTLAVSPYASSTERILSAARTAEHEYLLSIPMEPQEYPLNDPDDQHALMTSLPPTENMARLHWALSRIAGYVGVTNVLGPMGGERLAGMEDQFAPVLEEIGTRGLLFVDARPGQPAGRMTWSRSIDLMIDQDPVTETMLDSRLDALMKIAKDKGSALGLVFIPRPVTLDRLAAWSNTVADKGLVLAPVSALAQPPAKQEQEQ